MQSTRTSSEAPGSMALLNSPPPTTSYISRTSSPSLTNPILLKTNYPYHASTRWRTQLTVVAMSPKKKVNKYDDGWKKQWFGSGIFYEGSEEVEVDVFKTIEKRKVLSNVEKAGLLSKVEGLGFTLSSIEKLGLLSKAEDLGLLSLLENAATVSPSILASAAIPVTVAAIVTVVVIPDDSATLVAVQAVLGGALLVGAAGLFVGSVVIGGLQESD